MTKALPATGSEAPRSLRISANGLDHHVLEWPSAGDVKPGAAARTVFLLHGFLDAARSWDRIAPILAGQGFRLLAPDMRGFGEGDRAPRGSYYHFADYIADVAELIEALSSKEPVSLVGHSMGGTIATLYGGAFPENVVRLANLEGLGPPDNPWEVGPTRMRTWIQDLRALRARGEPAPLLREDALRRLVLNHPSVPPEVLAHRLPHLVRDVVDAEGNAGVIWRSDPRHRTTSPVPFFSRLFVEFARKVTCPVLFVSGGSMGYHPPDEEARIEAFANVERATLEGAGHMMHWTRPEELASLLTRFL